MYWSNASRILSSDPILEIHFVTKTQAVATSVLTVVQFHHRGPTDELQPSRKGKETGLCKSIDSTALLSGICQVSFFYTTTKAVFFLLPPVTTSHLGRVLRRHSMNA